MSIEATSLVTHGCIGINPTAKLTLLMIAEHAGKNSGGTAWPSVATLARLVGTTPRSIQMHLRELERRGWVATLDRGTGGRRHTRTYRLNLPRMEASIRVGKGEAGFRVYGVPKGEICDRKGEIQRTETLKPASPEPYLNRKNRRARAREGSTTGRVQLASPKCNGRESPTPSSKVNLKAEDLKTGETASIAADPTRELDMRPPPATFQRLHDLIARHVKPPVRNGSAAGIIPTVDERPRPLKAAQAADMERRKRETAERVAAYLEETSQEALRTAR